MSFSRTRIAAAALIFGFGAARAWAEDATFLDRDWLLDSAHSNVYMQTEKLEHTIEKHRFTSLDGKVSKNGDATLKIDLNSLDTGIDLRNVRMRFLLFETFKYPEADITAKIDKTKLGDFASQSRVSYVMKAHVDLHGVVKDLDIPVEIGRVDENTVSVSTIQPVEVQAETFDLTRGVGKLSEAMGGIRIVPGAFVSFDLMFGSGAVAPKLQAEKTQRESDKAKTETAQITEEGCTTRFDVMTESNAVYFKTGSSELEPSVPLLDAAADIAKRCPGVEFEVFGHTDNVGAKEFNRQLSEQRAKSVVEYLAAKGVSAARIHSAGLGDTRPVAPNDTEANRARNRRIEFKVRKQ